MEVEAAIGNYNPNHVLGTQPPPINDDVFNLLRKTRSVLAQLRSGRSKLLMNYMNKITPTIDDRCPTCDGGPYDTNHLFNYVISWIKYTQSVTSNYAIIFRLFIVAISERLCK